MPSSSSPITTLSSTHNDNSSPPGPLTITLQTPFLYQNRTTGQPSSTPLTARQLCRILCPVSSVSTIISPQILLLGFDATSNTYDSEGWRQASSVPVFREACSTWYYEGRGGVNGPVSTRMLAQSFFREEIDLATRVFGDNGNDQKDGEWKSIRDLPPLQLAMEALTESEMPSSWPVDTPWTGNQMANTTKDDDKNASDVIDAEVNRCILSNMLVDQRRKKGSLEGHNLFLVAFTAIRIDGTCSLFTIVGERTFAVPSFGSGAGFLLALDAKASLNVISFMVILLALVSLCIKSRV